MKRTVELPPRSSQSRAWATAARTSFTPLEVAESTSKRVRDGLREQSGQGRLAHPGGPQRTMDASRPRFDHAAQRAALADQRLLAHELGEVPRPHASRQGRVDGLTPAGAVSPGVRRRVLPGRCCPSPLSLVRAMRVATTI